MEIIFLSHIDLESVGEYTEAEEHLKKSLGIRMEVLGDYHPECARSYNGIGKVLRKKGTVVLLSLLCLPIIRTI